MSDVVLYEAIEEWAYIMNHCSRDKGSMIKICKLRSCTL